MEQWSGTPSPVFDMSGLETRMIRVKKFGPKMCSCVACRGGLESGLFPRACRKKKKGSCVTQRNMGLAGGLKENTFSTRRQVFALGEFTEKLNGD